MATNTPKTMSSRLAGMKFMQRSSASKVAPKTSQPSTPSDRPSKRIRLSNGHSAAATPATPSTPGTPLDPEALKAEEALRKLAEERGETKWVLSVQEPSTGADEGMRIAYAGFAAIDADSEESGEEQDRPVRMSYGGGVRRKKAVVRTQTTGPTEGASDLEADSDDDSEKDSSESEYDSDDPTAALIRETKRDVYAQEREARRGQKSLQQAKAQLVQEKRRSTVHEDDSLAGLTSLSGGRGPGGGGRPRGDVECFRCGQKGHIKSACPNASSSRGGGGGGGRGFGGRGGKGGRR